MDPFRNRKVIWSLNGRDELQFRCNPPGEEHVEVEGRG